MKRYFAMSASYCIFASMTETSSLGFDIIIVEDVPLELKGTEGIVQQEVPEARVIGTASNEDEFWQLINEKPVHLVLLDLGLGGSTTIGVEICHTLKQKYPQTKVMVFTGEVLNEGLWVDIMNAGADGIALKCGEMLTRQDILNVMQGKKYVFNQPILERIVEVFKTVVSKSQKHFDAMIRYEVDEYDERFLRHLALGYTKEQIANLRAMPFGIKSLEKRQNELIQKLFPQGNRDTSVNATRLVVKAIELGIIEVNQLNPDEC